MFSIIFTDGAVLCAFAEEAKQKVYTYNNFNVEYIIENKWDGAQSVKMKITNTGDESILNWYLKYSSGGIIENLYNAVTYSNSETECILKHNGYNYEIEPSSSVEFGYILRGENLTFPNGFELCNKRVEKKSGYTVDFNITSEWDNGFNADIVITNTTNKPIEAWALTFDSNFAINNYWNCKLLDNTNSKYTIANKLWTTPIVAGGSATFGFSANLIDGEKPYAKNWTLTEVVIDISEEKEEADFPIIGFVEYNNESNSLIISWLTEFENGSFEILSSDDGNKFKSIATVNDVYSYEYKITDSFLKRYFKIRQTLNSGRIGESNVLLVCKNKNGYAMEFTDTDDDGVPDYLETGLGLDINKADTDDDGLTDYEEMFLTGTDPMVYDSVKKDVSDSNADSDGDGLSNKKEIELGTDPVFEDTDDDGLSDGEEVNTYNTNPLKADTDDDGINDGDEISMGLDPLNPNTYGIPDKEYTFNVTLSEDSEAMSEINADNDYKLSIEITAAGNVEKNIDVRESNYSETIKNSAIIGKSFDIEYDTSCTTESAVIKFKLEDSLVNESESNANIERFCVFKLFEDYNVILPVYTEYNSNDNLVSAQIDELGTYCLMDMEKLVDNISSSNSENKESVKTLSFVDKPVVYANPRNISWQSSIDKSSINVVFIMDIRNNIDRETFDSVKSNVINAASEVLKESPNAKIYLILQHYDKESRDNLGYTLIEDEDEIYFTDPVRIFDELDYLRTWSVNKYNKYCILSDAIKYVFDNCDNSKGTYCFSIFDSTDVVYRTSLVGEDMIGVTESDDYGYEVLNRLSENQMDVSIISNISPEYNLGYAIDIYKSTGGIYIDGLYDFSDEVLKHIYGYVPNHDVESTVFYNGLNFEEMKLDREVTKDYLNAAKELKEATEKAEKTNKYSDIKSIRAQYSSFADTDSDGAYDFEEIDICNQLIKWDNDNIMLPTLQEYCDEINNSKVKKAMREYVKENWEPLLNINVMPTTSNPMNEDSDGDGLLDGKPYEYNDEILAPADNDPLVPNGSKDIWLTHIENAKNKNIPEEIGHWYGYTDPQLNNTELAGFQALYDEFLYLVENDKIDLLKIDVVTDMRCLIYSWYLYKSGDTAGYAIVQYFMNELKSKVVNKDEANEVMASLGSRFLNFKSDSTIGGYDGVIHSQPRSWQFVGGYNNLYDIIFGFGTNDNIGKEKFPFTVEADDMEYILWIWRGDYLNLGAGAEIGIYSRPSYLSQDPDFFDHYFVDYDLALPMQLYLYEYNGADKINNVFSWRPNDDQWWITGFNPEYVNKVDVKKLVSVGCIDFTGHEEMYDALKTSTLRQNTIKDYAIFDDINLVVWLCWYERNLLQ